MKNIKIGLQRNVTDPCCPVESVTLENVLHQMRDSDNLKSKTVAIRNAETKEQRDKLKLKLPAIIISADTTCRKASDEDIRNPLIYIDLDLDDNPDVDMGKVVESMDYGWLIGHQESPSGGLKVLCGVEPNVETHKQSFEALEDTFARHGLVADKSCKDIKRLTFLNHSPDIYRTLIKPLLEWKGETIEPLEKKIDPPTMVESGSLLTTPPMAHNSNLSPDEEAEACLAYISPDAPYDEWVGVGMALKSHGVSPSVWESWSSGGTKYKQGEPLKKWESFNGNGIGFGTLVEMAKRNNGGVSPLARQRDPVSISKDFEDLTEAEKAAIEDADEKLWQFMQERQYDEMEVPEHQPPLVGLKGKGVIWRANVHTLVAQSKAGKTHDLAALIRTAVTGERTLGWTVDAPCNGMIAYLDFEQDAEDFYHLLCRHAGVTSSQVKGYRLAGLDAHHAQRAAEMILERTPDLCMLIIDGYADLSRDVNSQEEAVEIVQRWMDLTTKYNVALLGVLHLNPGSETKSRGHLGSQLERKSKTVLQIDVDSEGIRETYTYRARKQPVPKGHGASWQWCDDEGCFVEIMETRAEAKQLDKAQKLKDELDNVINRFDDDDDKWSYTALVNATMEVTKLKDRASKNRIKTWVKSGWLVQADDDLYKEPDPF